MTKPAGLILFDIDSTLLVGGDAHHGAAFTHAFETVYGHPVTLEGVPLAGMLDSQIARLLFDRHGLARDESDQRLREMMTMMGDRYVEAIADSDLRERLLPGAAEAVVACHEYGWAVGALTGNGRAVGEAKLHAAGLSALISFGAYGDAAVERGHLVEEGLAEAELVTGVAYTPAQTILVGDTPHDISAARLGGAHVIAVATGRFSVDALREHDPDAVMADLSDTAAFVAAVERILR
jgi:phosphoglycolate phosphatase-like HAD superfamily hydrolase